MDFPTRLRELREASGYSLRELSKRTSYSRTYLSNLQRGQRQPPPETAKIIDAALDADGELAELAETPGATPHRKRPDPGPRRYTVADGLSFAPTWARGIEAVTGLWRWDVRRRELLQRAAFTSSAYLGPAMRWLTSPLDERPAGAGRRTVDERDVDTIREVTATYRVLDNRHGGAHIRGPVTRFLDSDVAPLLREGRYEGPIAIALLSAAAETTQLAAWASYDSGLHGLAQMYMIQALRLAFAARDIPLGAEILAGMSHQAAYLGYAAEAVDLARTADRIAERGGIAAIRAEAAVLEAHGHAVAGDEAACADALSRAEHCLDQADRHADPQWIGYFDEAYLAARFGHCFAALGRGELARRFAARSLQMDTRYRRGRQFNLALLATAHVQAAKTRQGQPGEIEEAAAVGVKAIESARGLKSERAVDYIAQLADRLAPYAGLSAVDGFFEQARELLATGDRSPGPAAQPGAR